MVIHDKNPFDPVGGTETPESVVLHRRRWLKQMGWWAAAGVGGIGGYQAWRYWSPRDEEVLSHGQVTSSVDSPTSGIPNLDDATAEEKQLAAELAEAVRDQRFTYDRDETARAEAAKYTNFYEFSRFKSVWRHVDAFKPRPWTIRIDGLCDQPLTLDLDDFQKRFATELSERQYRHRCVEKWAMAVPWVGVPLAAVLKAVAPQSSATHVRFVSFKRPNEAPFQNSTPQYPWPYQEGLTLAEATNDLTFLALGMYGKPLLKQHGAPIRLVVPWKYGFKSSKSIERIELIDYEPSTFWSTLNPAAYPFESNVEPDVPRPWAQHTETMLGSGEQFATKLYNGYGEYVAHLYK